MDLDHLESFLAEVKGKSLCGEVEFDYENGLFRYSEARFGSDQEAGEVIVHKGEEAVWYMRYLKHKKDDIVPDKKVYDFLRKVIDQPHDTPLGCPKYFKNGELEYFNHFDGTLGDFEGVEHMLYDGEKFYQMCYYGGLI